MDLIWYCRREKKSLTRLCSLVWQGIKDLDELPTKPGVEQSVRFIENQCPCRSEERHDKPSTHTKICEPWFEIPVLQ